MQLQSLDPLQVSPDPHCESPHRHPDAVQSGVVPVHASPVGALAPAQLHSLDMSHVSPGPHCESPQRQPTPAKQSGAVGAVHASPDRAVVGPH
jgi:hypothetical protein